MKSFNKVGHRLFDVCFVISPVLLEPFAIIIALQRTEELQAFLRKSSKGSFIHERHYMKAEFKSPPSILDKYTALVDISCRLNSEKNFDQLLKLIADEATKHLDAERATILILDKEKGELWAKIALGVSDTLRFDSRLGIAGAVLLSGKPIIVEDAYKSPLFYQSIDSTTGFHTRNILSVPLRNPKQEVIGVFQVLNKKDGRFTTDDEHFVLALANQAAVALENSFALADLESRQQELIQENQHLRKEIEERFTNKSILGTNAKMNDIRSIIEKS